MDGVLCRYGEIGIKSAPVRRQMTERLRQNLLDGMVRRGVEGDAVVRGPRIWLTGPDAEALADAAAHTFGVVSASPARTCEATLAAMGALAAEMAAGRAAGPTAGGATADGPKAAGNVPGAAEGGIGWSSFAVRARREGKHPFSSQDMGRDIGSAVWSAAEGAGGSPSVDLDDPDLEVFVEARGKTAYVYTDVVAGPGGLPVGSQGRVVVLLSDVASFVAAWLMMRRGCEVVPVHAGTTASLPVESVERLRAWGMPEEVEVLPICSGYVSKGVLVAAAARIGVERGAVAVVTGETLGSELGPVQDVAAGGPPLPVLRPVCGLLPEAVAAWQARIGLEAEYTDAILDAEAGETVESALSMRRTVSP